MSWRYWFVGPLERFVELLPRFIARPLKSSMAFVYFQSDELIYMLLPTMLAGGLVPVLLYDLPPPESIPAVLAVAALMAIVWRQDTRVTKLREELKALEIEMEDDALYQGDNEALPD